jgi:hypothetical protein
MGQTRCLVHLQALCRTGDATLEGTLGAVDVVSQKVCPCPIALCLNGHSYLQL